MMKEEKVTRYKFHILAILLIIIYCVSIAPKYLQNDTFYTIKVGEYISQNGIGNLRNDPFSWHELPYTFPHWLYDLMMFVFYSIGGMKGIYISTIAFTSILGICIYLTSNKVSKNAPISAIIVFFTMYLMKPYIAARAQLVTFSLIVLAILFIERFLENANFKNGLCLVLLSLLIVNLHMAVWPFFFVIFVPYFAEYVISLNIFTVDVILKLKILIEKKKKNKESEEKIEELKNKINQNKKRREEIRENPYKIKVTRNDNIKKLFIVVIICAIMGIFTPTGISTPYTYLYKTMTGNTMKVINEHLPLDLAKNKDFAAFFVLFILILTFIDVKIDLKHLLYYFGILYLALNSRRQASMFLVVCTPILAKIFADIFKKYAPELENKFMKIVTNFYIKVFLMTAMIIIGIQNLKPKIKSEYYSNKDYPIYATQWIKENLDYKNIKLFNEYNYGSYLLFNDIPVMIDSRCDLYTPQYNTKTGKAKDGQDIFMDVQNVATGKAEYNDTFTLYGVTHIITYSDSRISKRMKNDANYEKIYPLSEEEKNKDNRFVIYKKLDAQEDSE